MVLEPVHCRDCNSINVVRHGKTAQRKQRYLCRNKDCKRRSFIKNYSYRAYEGEVKQKITDMAINGSGIRDTALFAENQPQHSDDYIKKNSHIYSR